MENTPANGVGHGGDTRRVTWILEGIKYSTQSGLEQHSSFMCALLHVIYDRDNLKSGAGGITDSGDCCHLSPEGGEDSGTFYLQEIGYCYGYCMKNKLLLNHSLKCLPWSFHDAAFIFQ